MIDERTNDESQMKRACRFIFFAPSSARMGYIFFPSGTERAEAAAIWPTKAASLLLIRSPPSIRGSEGATRSAGGGGGDSILKTFV